MKPANTRPLHRQFALHPLTLMVLLCSGVFIVGSTFRATAEDLQVTAEVHAAPLTSPAVITSFYDQQHTTEAEGDVAGTCPADSYVKLYRNGTFVGVAQCENGTFHIPVVFEAGANKLEVKAYNVTDDEGPLSPAITVYYDNVSVTPQEPSNVPTGLTVFGVDASRYRDGIIIVTGNYPTFSGFAPPFSRVAITVGPNSIQCLTTANRWGWWSCTFSQALEPGLHSVEVVAVTPDGRALRFPIFYIRVVASQPSLRRDEGDIKPIVINATYRYQARRVDEIWNWDVSVSGGVLPYKVTIDWGDGTTSNRDRDDTSYFTISHAYKHAGTYYPTIRVVDANGQSNRVAVMQLLAIVKPTDGAPMSSSTTPAGGIGHYLWLIWPTYIAILLMVLSFWLGELEVVRKLRLRHR